LITSPGCGPYVDDATAVPPLAANATFVRVPPDVTVTVIAADVVEAPPLSVATAVSAYVPAATLLHVTPYGLVVSVPIGAPFAKNCTDAIVPSVSPALAVTRSSRRRKARPAGRAVSATVGDYCSRRRPCRLRPTSGVAIGRLREVDPDLRGRQRRKQHCQTSVLPDTTPPGTGCHALPSILRFEARHPARVNVNVDVGSLGAL
jgi:hypothetical protein